ncbi:MAG: YjbH domain-containing protein, partial [Nitrososphaerota archaeon]
MKYLFIVILFPLNFIYPQTIAGYSGLFTIPTGKLYNDGTMNFSFTYLDKKYVSFSSYKENAMVYSATLTFLPFMEINTNFVYLLNHKGTQGIGDRSVGFRLQLLEEDTHYINFSTGINNIGTAFGGIGAIHKQSIYLVASRSFFDGKFNIIIGNGFKVFKAADYQFIGLFGGISYKPFNFLEGIIEY